MTTAYTSLLGLALPVTGELSGTWGDTVNNSITSLLDSAIAGTTTLSTDADVTLTTTTGASNTSREAILLWTAGGTITRTITAPAQSKIYTVINASSSTQSIKVVGAGPTTGVTIVKGESALIAWNGSDFVKVSNTGGSFTTQDLTVTGNTILGDAITDTSTLNAQTRFLSLATLGYSNMTGPAATSLSTTAPAFLYSGATTYTVADVSGGTKAHAPIISLGQATIANATTATTFTNASTLYIAGAPSAGTNITLTNPYALYIAAGNVYLGGGTANGVAYLNGSNVLTTGSALTFDGSQLGIGTASGTSNGLKLNSGNAGANYVLYRASATGLLTIYGNQTGFNGLSVTGVDGDLATLTSTGLGIGTSSPSGKLDVYYNASAINPGATSGAAGNLRAGTGTFALTGSNNRGIGTLINTNQNINTTLPYGGSFETFGLLSVANAQSGGNYTVYGVAGYSRSDGPATAFRADATQTTAGAEAYGYYVGTVSGGSTNYGVYVSDTSAKNYFGGNVGIGTSSPTAKLQISVASAAVNGTKGVRITNPAGTIVMLECGSGGDSFVGTESGSTFNIRTNNAINATFLTSGDVGIGETSPTQRLHIKGSSTTYALAETTGTGTSSGFRMKAGASADYTLYTTQGTNQFAIYDNVASSQRLTIDSSGNLLVGKTTAGNSINGAQLSSTYQFFTNTSDYTSIFNRRGTDGISVYFQKAETNVGTISVTTVATTFNSLSDYRLKNITGSLTGAKDFIMALQPKQGTWKADGSKFVGFLAHEFQEISPSSVTGEKDAIDADGKPIMQSMQASSAEVMANLIAFVQELKAEFDAYKASHP